MRNTAVRLLGAPSTTTGQTANEHEVLLGGDSRDLAVRISVSTTPDAVTCATLTRAATARGRAYLAVVRPIHPYVVRAMLRRAARTLSAPAGPARPGACAAAP